MVSALLKTNPKDATDVIEFTTAGLMYATKWKARLDDGFIAGAGADGFDVNAVGFIQPQRRGNLFARLARAKLARQRHHRQESKQGYNDYNYAGHGCHREASSGLTTGAVAAETA